MCLILKRDEASNELQYYAGASLIAPGVVLSAAHYLNEVNLDDLVVRCGDWDIKTNQVGSEHSS